MLHRLIPSLAVLTILAAGCAPAEDAPEPAADDPQAQLLARAAELELPGEYVLPPGDALVHSTAGFAKILCSNVFLSGLDPDFAAEHVGFFSAPREYRGGVTDRVVDYENQRVHLTLADGTVRSAKLHGDQGCLALPIGEEEPYYETVEVTSTLPDAETTPGRWATCSGRNAFRPTWTWTSRTAVEAAFAPPKA